MISVRNIALKDRDGQMWPLSPVVTGDLERWSNKSQGGATLSLRAGAVPDELQADAVVAVSADHPTLQPAHAVGSVELRTHSGNRDDRWVLRLDESAADESL